MKIYTSLAVGAALIAASAVASADELSNGIQTPVQLTDQQMEDVTAAGRKKHGKKYRYCYGCYGLAVADADANAYGGRYNDSAAFAYTHATPHSAHSSASSTSYSGN